MRDFICAVVGLFFLGFVFSLGFATAYFSKNSTKSKSEMTSVNLVIHRTYNKPVKKPVEAKKTLYKIYKVKNGDSIYRISRKFLVLEWQLRKANKLAKNVTIYPGQSLKIPNIDWCAKSYEGRASWYGPGFHGKKMANGQVYNQDEILIAHRTLPLGMRVRITNLENGKSLTARVLDRGPYTKKNGKYAREIDLSLGAAKSLGTIKEGVVPVRIEPLG